MGQFAHLGEVEGLNQIAVPISRTDPANANADGMQDAHIQGAKLFNEDLRNLRARGLLARHRRRGGKLPVNPCSKPQPQGQTSALPEPAETQSPNPPVKARPDVSPERTAP